METAALIVAAGMSSRMGEFKPMLNIGSISIAKRIVATFQQAGIKRIVMVTGFNAAMLEHHLASCGLIFLRNDNYETTHMFDSALIGLNYLKEKCDRILFTPVDIPLFTASTVKAIMDCNDKLVCPVFKTMQGHPILIASSLIDTLAADSGEGGLKGALSRCGTEMRELEVDDIGILHDADTPEDYRNLLSIHNSQLVRPVTNLSLAKEMPFFDRKMYMLLTLVDETRSVRLACQRMQISYSTGWNIIRTLESQLSRPLIERSQGGSKGSQSTLTEYGRDFLERFRSLDDELSLEAERLFIKYFDGQF